MDDLPDPELTPDDLHNYAETKFQDISAAIAAGDFDALERHTRELAAEGSAELSHRFTAGLLEIGMVKLARTTRLTSEWDERTRAAFLNDVDTRPGPVPQLPHPRWSRGRERRYLLLRAALFHAYATEHAGGDDEWTRLVFELGANVAASELLAWDALHDTHLGSVRAISELWRENARGYVAQERIVAKLLG